MSAKGVETQLTHLSQIPSLTPVLRDSDSFCHMEHGRSWKEVAKRALGRFYPIAVTVLSPVKATPFVKRFLSDFDPRSDIIVNLGAGLTSYREGIINVDLSRYPTLDVVANAEKLPFETSSVNAVLTVAMLEHVPRPAQIVREINRILKPDGQALCFIPFLQGIHGSPSDFQRYTPNGLRELFKDFEVLTIEVGAGPTSSLIWVLQEWLAIALSFGSRRLYWTWYFLLFALTPLKFLDIVLVRHPMATQIASGFVIKVRKRGDGMNR